MSDKSQEAIPADRFLEPYWAAAGEGMLLLRRCADCGKLHYYPRPLCPFCLSGRGEWITASGDATVYSFSIERRANPPYAIAFVTLSEGPTLMTNLVDCDPYGVAIGQAVRLTFEEREGRPVPCFKPA